jgi:hypothetical protein
MSGVELRAFRGTHRSAVYRAYEVEHEAFRRIVGAAGSELLPTVSRLEPDETFDARAARRIATELTQLRSTAALVELDGDLAALAEVANWCAHARGDAWLMVRRLDG